jgi:hypothetical protein
MSNNLDKNNKHADAEASSACDVMRTIGFWEEYRCGCVSETVNRRRDLMGYCPKHGEDRRRVHRDRIICQKKGTKCRYKKARSSNSI